MFKNKIWSVLVSSTAFVAMWVLLGKPLAQLLFQSVFSAGFDAQIPWIMVLGYAVGSICEGVAWFVRSAFHAE